MGEQEESVVELRTKTIARPDGSLRISLKMVSYVSREVIGDIQYSAQAERDY